MKTAVLYDDLVQRGGGERFLKDVCKAVGEYDLFIPICSKENVIEYGVAKRSRCLSFLSNLGKYGYYSASVLSVLWFEKINTNSYARVLVLSNRFSLSTVTSDETPSYLIVTNPNRHLWRNSTIKNSILFNILRVRDYYYSKRYNQIISISRTVKKRVSKYWREDSIVISPPVKRFVNSIAVNIDLPFKDYYLIVGRQSKYKTPYFEQAIDNFPKDERLVFVGHGEKFNKLADKYSRNKNVYFTGFVSEQQLGYLYKSCLALIHPQVEDFGLTPLEALQFNKPVIAYNKGGVTEYLNSKVAVLFTDHTKLKDHIKRSKSMKFDKNTARKIVQLHSFENFKYNLEQICKHYEKSS